MSQTFSLKGGFTTTDRRLDRVPQFDERSRNFSISERVPRTLKSRTHPSNLWLDQGREGACVSFAWHHEAGASPVTIKNLTNEVARTRYWDMQRNDQWPGGSYPGAQPVYEGTSVISGAQIMQSLGFFAEYRWAFNMDDALLAICHEGGVVFGIPWLDSMFDTRPDGTLDCSGNESGGHAIFGRGVIVPRKGVATVTFPRSKRVVRIKTDVPLVRLRNSWSWDWGIDGECLVRADDLERLLNSGGECCVPVDRRRPNL